MFYGNLLDELILFVVFDVVYVLFVLGVVMNDCVLVFDCVDYLLVVVVVLYMLLCVIFLIVVVVSLGFVIV